MTTGIREVCDMGALGQANVSKVEPRYSAGERHEFGKRVSYEEIRTVFCAHRVHSHGWL